MGKVVTGVLIVLMALFAYFIDPWATLGVIAGVILCLIGTALVTQGVCKVLRIPHRVDRDGILWDVRFGQGHPWVHLLTPISNLLFASIAVYVAWACGIWSVVVEHGVTILYHMFVITILPLRPLKGGLFVEEAWPTVDTHDLWWFTGLAATLVTLGFLYEERSVLFGVCLIVVGVLHIPVLVQRWRALT